MRKLFTGIALTLALGVSSASVTRARAAGNIYDMLGLKALEKQSAWTELVDHLLDVPPSKRDATWQALAEKSCGEYIASLPIKENQGKAVFAEIDDLFRRIPEVKTAQVMAKRADVGLKIFHRADEEFRHLTGSRR